MPLVGDKNAVVHHTVKKLQTSRNLKTHFRLIQIAENCEESVFQKNDEYLKFKGQKNISTWDIEVLLCRLRPLDYSEEKIYWNKRALEEKVGDKEQRYVFFYNLVCIYENLGEYELVLEYGQKPMEWLDSFKEKLGIHTIYYLMNCLITSSRRLNRFEESIGYEKERLKVIIKSYNSGESVYEDKTPIKKDDLLHCYMSLIDSQIRCKHFEDALKSFKKIKLFKLDSIDPDDVDESMRQFDATVEIPYDRCNLLTIIGDLCKLKSQAFHGLGDKENGSLWSALAIDVCVTLQEVTRSFEKNDDSPGELDLQNSWQNSFTTQLVKTSLTIAELDPSKRRELFNQTMCYLLYESKHASFYISKFVQDDFMNFETLIPFIEHFIKRCTKDVLAKVKKRLEHVKYEQKIDPNFSLEDQRKQMVTYQNSLLIMKHFNGLP
jgi:tetratricopeptide (TPR) repeat protein